MVVRFNHPQKKVKIINNIEFSKKQLNKLRGSRRLNVWTFGLVKLFLLCFSTFNFNF